MTTLFRANGITTTKRVLLTKPGDCISRYLIQVVQSLGFVSSELIFCQADFDTYNERQDGVTPSE
jgi:hypothetical protein